MLPLRKKQMKPTRSTADKSLSRLVLLLSCPFLLPQACDILGHQPCVAVFGAPLKACQGIIMLAMNACFGGKKAFKF